MTTLGSPWLVSLNIRMDRLLPWVLAAVTTVGVPSADSIGLSGSRHHVSQLDTIAVPSASPLPRTADQPIFFEDEMVVLQDARKEASLALGVLQTVGAWVGSSEVENYLHAVDLVLDATPATPTVADAQRLADGLRAARIRLVEETSAFPIWLTVSSVLDPSGGPHAVPSRFVRSVEGLGSEPMQFNEADRRVRHAVARFTGEDADTASRHG